MNSQMCKIVHLSFHARHCSHQQVSSTCMEVSSTEPIFTQWFKVLQESLISVPLVVITWFLSFCAGKSYGIEVVWMDSMTDEAKLWQNMLQSNGEWVEDVLPLRKLVMAKSTLKWDVWSVLINVLKLYGDMLNLKHNCWAATFKKSICIACNRCILSHLGQLTVNVVMSQNFTLSKKNCEIIQDRNKNLY